MKHLRRIASAILTAGLLASPAMAEPALWKVSDADSSIYLFGSIHLFTRDTNWRTPRFDAILKSARHVYFEVILDADAYKDITYIGLTEGWFKDGHYLGDFVSNTDWEKLVEASDKVGFDYTKLRKMKPWRAAAQLAPASIQNAAAGVEMLIEQEVEPERIRALETAAEQIRLFTDAPMDEQVDALNSVVDSVLAGTSTTLDLSALMDAWESGDTATLEGLMADEVTPGTERMYARLLDERNAKWLPTLEKLLADNDESLVVVGAAHLVGTTGVPALLEARGYTVERVDSAAADLPRAADAQPVKPR